MIKTTKRNQTDHNTETETKAVINRSTRVALAKEDIFWFFRIYFSHYITCESAPFHREILELLQNQDEKLLAIVAFRGSAKSTLCDLVYVLWAALCRPSLNFIIIVNQTQSKAQYTMDSIKQELLSNELLINDFGLIQKSEDDWKAQSIVVSKTKVRITVSSTSESIRGIRHGEHRPDLIICDDIEDPQSARTKENRDKLWRFVNGELIPAGHKDTRHIYIGNLVHEDSVMMKLKEKILEKKLQGSYREYKLINDYNEITWKGMYPNMEAVNKLKKKIGNYNDFLQEYMLQIVPSGDRVVHREWIHYYDEIPPTSNNDFQYVTISVDLAISEKATGDFTAIVCSYVFGYGYDRKIYIERFPFNKRISFPEVILEIERKYQSFIAKNLVTRVFVEDVGIQGALTQQLKTLGIVAYGVSIKGDKRTRLAQTTALIQSGNILFPKTGAENLIQQMVGFGVEKHDDLVDAFSMNILELVKKPRRKARVFYKPHPFSIFN